MTSGSVFRLAAKPGPECEQPFRTGRCDTRLRDSAGITPDFPSPDINSLKGQDNHRLQEPSSNIYKCARSTGSQHTRRRTLRPFGSGIFVAPRGRGGRA